MCEWPCCAKAEWLEPVAGRIRELEERVAKLEKSYIAHLAHAHGIFATPAKTTYVGIRERITEHDEEEG